MGQAAERVAELEQQAHIDRVPELAAGSAKVLHPPPLLDEPLPSGRGPTPAPSESQMKPPPHADPDTRISSDIREPWPNRRTTHDPAMQPAPRCSLRLSRGSVNADEAAEENCAIK